MVKALRSAVSTTLEKWLKCCQLCYYVTQQSHSNTVYCFTVIVTHITMVLCVTIWHSWVVCLCPFILISTNGINLCFILTLTVTQGKLTYSDVSCLCSVRQNLEWNCFNSKTITFELPFYVFHMLYALHCAHFEGTCFVLFIITIKSFYCVYCIVLSYLSIYLPGVIFEVD